VVTTDGLVWLQSDIKRSEVSDEFAPYLSWPDGTTCPGRAVEGNRPYLTESRLEIGHWRRGLETPSNIDNAVRSGSSVFTVLPPVAAFDAQFVVQLTR